MVGSGSVHVQSPGRGDVTVAGELYDFIIFLVGLIILVAVLLWAIKWLLPTAYEPARYVIGGLALIAILIRLKPFILRAFS